MIQRNLMIPGKSKSLRWCLHLWWSCSNGSGGSDRSCESCGPDGSGWSGGSGGSGRPGGSGRGYSFAHFPASSFLPFIGLVLVWVCDWRMTFMLLYVFCVAEFHHKCYICLQLLDSATFFATLFPRIKISSPSIWGFDLRGIWKFLRVGGFSLLLSQRLDLYFKWRNYL